MATCSTHGSEQSRHQGCKEEEKIDNLARKVGQFKIQNSKSKTQDSKKI
jgi:hypothetical protein